VKPEEVRELLPLYALGALEPEERERLEAALKAYPELWAEARALQETAADLAALVPPAPVPPGLEQRVMARLRPSRRLILPIWLSRAAALLLLLGLGYSGGWGAFRLLSLRDPETRVVALASPKGEVVGRVIQRKDKLALVLLDRWPPRVRFSRPGDWFREAPPPCPPSVHRLRACAFPWKQKPWRSRSSPQVEAVSPPPCWVYPSRGCCYPLPAVGGGCLAGFL